MSDLAVALGLVLVIEGLLWALAPGFARQMLEVAAASGERQLRTAGWVAVVIGTIVVYLVRG